MDMLYKTADAHGKTHRDPSLNQYLIKDERAFLSYTSIKSFPPKINQD